MDIQQSLLLDLPADVQRLVAAVLESRSFRRLKKISFLGAIDRFAPEHVKDNDVSSGSRFDHSVGVANIVLAIAGRMNLSAGELRLAVANALLHDIGHGPYSHSSEPFFLKTFGINHHKALCSLVEDESSEVSRILKGFGLWIDYRRFIRSPASIPAVECLFYGPINVDTIEGIIRAAKFFRIETSLDLRTLTQSIGRTHVPIRPLDQFWNLKSAVYNEHIFASRYAYYDEALTSSLHSMKQLVRLDHFYFDDELFEQSLGADLQRSLSDEYHRITVRRAARVRTFRINKDAAPRQFNALEDRYNEVRGSDGSRAEYHYEK